MTRVKTPEEHAAETEKKKLAELERKKQAFVKAANSDGPKADDEEPEAKSTDDKVEDEKKPRKKPRPRNLVFVGVKLEARTRDSIDEAAMSRGLGLSEMMRQVILAGMQTMEIKHREEPFLVNPSEPMKVAHES